MVSSHPLFPPLQSSSSSSPLVPRRFWVPSPAEEGHMYHPKDTGSIVTQTTLIGLGVGTAISAFQNALDKHQKGAMGIFTRTGGIIVYFTALGFAYSSVSSITANVRETDDWRNSAAGGCAAGFIAGVRAKSLPTAVGGCALMATLVGTYEATGGALLGVHDGGLTRPEQEEARKAFYKARVVSGLKEDVGAAQPA